MLLRNYQTKEGILLNVHFLIIHITLIYSSASSAVSTSINKCVLHLENMKPGMLYNILKVCLCPSPNVPAWMNQCLTVVDFGWSKWKLYVSPDSLKQVFNIISTVLPLSGTIFTDYSQHTKWWWSACFSCVLQGNNQITVPKLAGFILNMWGPNCFCV